MPIVTPADLKTHIYPEIQDIISRGDATIVTTAIARAIREAKLYLSRFDLVALFGTDSTPATITDDFLNGLIKDMALWHLLRLAAPNMDMPITRAGYTDAIRTLTKLQRGGMDPGGTDPDNWSYADKSNVQVPDGDAIEYASRPKRGNHW